ncbi:MAG: hypothetical protein WD847_15595 [Pirellulales bacterium]
MADADWANYKQLRGRMLPERIAFRGAQYRLEQLFKRDFYAATGLYHRLNDRPRSQRPERIVLKIYHTDPLGFIPLGWLGRFLCNREVYFYQATEGIPGLPRFLQRHGKAGYIREYVHGCHLRDYRKTNRIDERFYPKLQAMLAAIHERGISHNDLSKAENILVRPNGSPVLIDFQIATTFQFPLLRRLGGHPLRYMQSVDRYHVGKHHRKDRPQEYSPAQLRNSRRKGLLLTLHGWMLRRPYRAVRHLVMNRFMRVETQPAAAGVESSRSSDQFPRARAA